MIRSTMQLAAVEGRIPRSGRRVRAHAARDDERARTHDGPRRRLRVRVAHGRARGPRAARPPHRAGTFHRLKPPRRADARDRRCGVHRAVGPLVVEARKRHQGSPDRCALVRRAPTVLWEFRGRSTVRSARAPGSWIERGGRDRARIHRPGCGVVESASGTSAVEGRSACVTRRHEARLGSAAKPRVGVGRHRRPSVGGNSGHCRLGCRARRSADRHCHRHRRRRVPRC